MRRGNPAFLVVFGFFVFFLAMRHPRFADIPNVLILQLVASGACFGIGIALLVVGLRAKKNPS